MVSIGTGLTPVPVRVIGWVDDAESYPIAKKRHTFEYLRTQAHLRPRTNTFGAITRVRHSLAHMTRAVMEGLAYNNRWVKAAAEAFIRRPIDQLRFSGGGALSDVWSQIHADVLGSDHCPVELRLRR